MAAGIPLGDDDRQGWLRALAERLGEARDSGRGVVVACSALKRSYRDRLRAGAAPVAVRFIHLAAPRALLATRLDGRRGHFMPAALLDSQLETLEPPSPDEDAWAVDVRESPDALVAALVRRTTT